VFKDRAEFEKVLDAAAKKAGIRFAAPVRRAIVAALSERDETAAICGELNPLPLVTRPGKRLRLHLSARR
jgi:type I restriction enzyme M protein